MLAATSAIAAVQGSAAGGGLLVLLLAETSEEENDAFENVFSIASHTDGFPSLPCLCCCAVLQLKLQQRRTREELVSQGIMPRKYHFSSFS